MATGNSGGGVGSAAVRAGGAFVELFTKDGGLSKGLQKARGMLSAFANFTSKVGGMALKTGAGLIAPVAALFAGTIEKSKGGIFGAKAQSDANRFTNAWARAILSLQGALVPVLAYITPLMERLGAVVRGNAGIVQVILGVGVGLVALGLALKGISVVTMAASLAFGALKLVLVAVTSPVILLVAGLAALVVWLSTGNSHVRNIGETIIATFQGIVAAIGNGQIELAWKVALAGLKLAWFDTVEWMKSLLKKLTSEVKGAGAIGGGIAGGVAGLKIGRFFGPVGALIGAGLGGAAGAIGGNELEKELERSGAFRPDDAGRANLAAELAALLAQVKQGKPQEIVNRGMIDAVKGTFQSGNLRSSLGYGDSVKALEIAGMQLAIQEGIAADVAEIRKNGGMRFQ